MAKQYLVLGAGIAGLSAAYKIRCEDPEAEITLIGSEKDSPYLRPLLSKTDFRRLHRQKILIAEDRWYEENRIILMKECPVNVLDPKQHKVILSDGRKLSYDKCIYALGAESFIPPICGKEKEGVLTLRSIGDFHNLKKHSLTAKEAVLIGGGVIGIEMAWELIKLGIHCTILEAMPYLMARMLDAESADKLKDRIIDAGCQCCTGVEIKKITGEEKVSGVLLKDGRFFRADIVILSTGVRAVTGPALDANIKCDRGVVTDSRLFTNDPDILAAGDCIQCGTPNPGLWNYARISGETAGYNAVHPDNAKIFEAGSFPLIMSAMGIGLFAAGNTEETEQVTTKRKVWKNTEEPGAFFVNQNMRGEETFEKKFYRDLKLCGAVLIGDISGMTEILNEL